jgi:hypothetical protein
MFTHLTDLTKSIWFYLIAFGLVLVASLASGLLGVDPGLGLMFTPLIAVLAMFFVVTRDGFSSQPGVPLVCTWPVSGAGGWRCWRPSGCLPSPTG